MTAKYLIGAQVKIQAQGKYFGHQGVVTGHRAFHSGWPGDKTIWRYEVKLDNGRTVWCNDRVLIHLPDLDPT
jgi:hypothetical protein